jgi:hypothetical protein
VRTVALLVLVVAAVTACSGRGTAPAAAARGFSPPDVQRTIDTYTFQPERDS